MENNATAAINMAGELMNFFNLTSICDVMSLVCSQKGHGLWWMLSYLYQQDDGVTEIT